MSLPSTNQLLQSRAILVRPLAALDSSNEALTVFLAGSTTSQEQPDWRTRLSSAIADLPVTIFDPKNSAWDSTWKESFKDERWTAQHRWEMRAREDADVVVFCFEAGTDAPISLLELGLTFGCRHRSSRVVMFAAKDYSRRAYVESVSQGRGVATHDDEGEFVAEVRAAIHSASRAKFGYDIEKHA